jgi:hypothetical protein
MPVFTIGTPGGRKLTIDAPDEATAIKGAQEWDAANPAKSEGYVDAARAGLGSAIGGVGETLKQYGPEATQGVAEKLKSAGDFVSPANYDPATVVTKDGINAGNVPRAVVESAPGLASAVAAARLTPGPWWLKALAGGLTGTAQTLGRNAKESAVTRTGDANAEPNLEEKTANAIAAVPSTALGAFGVSRFLPGAATKGVGAVGASNALKRLAGTAAIEGGTNAGQDVIEQVGRTATSDGGPQIDPYAAANAGVVGTATGSTFGAPRAVRDVGDAVKYRGVNEQTAAQLANRLTATGVDVSKPKGGFEAFTQVKSDLGNELKTLIADVKDTAEHSPESKNALARARTGNVTDNDLGHIADAVKGLPEADAITALVEQTRLANKLTNTKGFRDGRFTGGVSGLMERSIRALANPIGAGAAAGLAATTGGANMGAMFTAGPQALAALAGTYGLARTVDKFTGNRSPAKRFVRKFADPNVAVRPGVLPNDEDLLSKLGRPGVRPGQPWGPNPDAPGPTGPRISQPTPAPQADIKVANLLGRLNATDTEVRLRNGDLMPAGFDKKVMEIVKGINAQQRLKDRDSPANLLMRLNTTDRTLQRQPAMQEAAPAEMSPLELPKSVTGPAKTISSALAWRDKLKQANLGEQQAQQEAAASPALERTVGIDAVQNPQAGKRMSQMVSQARAIMKLRQDPAATAAEEEAATMAKDEAKQAKRDAKAAVAAAKMQAPKPEKIVAAAVKTTDATEDGKPAMSKALAEAPKPKKAAEDLTTLEGRQAAYDRVQEEANTVYSSDGERQLDLRKHTSAGMDPREAAEHIADMQEDRGNAFRNGRDHFVDFVETIQTAKDELARKLARVLKVDQDKMIEHVRALTGRSDARYWRDEFIDFEPEKAAQITELLSDTVIDKGRIWPSEKKKKS